MYFSNFGQTTALKCKPKYEKTGFSLFGWYIRNPYIFKLLACFCDCIQVCLCQTWSEPRRKHQRRVFSRRGSYIDVLAANAYTLCKNIFHIFVLSEYGKHRKNKTHYLHFVPDFIPLLKYRTNFNNNNFMTIQVCHLCI